MPGDATGGVIDFDRSAPTGNTDVKLVARTRERGAMSGVAIEALLRRHENAIYRACLSWLRDEDNAQEASQEVLIRVYRGVDGFQGRSNFRTWLYRIIHNACCTAAAHHARHRVCVSLEDNAHLLDAVASVDFGPSMERTHTVHAAMQRLSASDRSVL